MLSVLLWKEYREQRIVWAGLAFLGAAGVLSRPILAGAGWLDTHSEPRISLMALAVVLVGVYALVCGAMMLAGERENGTLPYLDALPGLRRRVWQGKFLAGLLLIIAQMVLLMGLCSAPSLFENWREAAFTLAAMFVIGLYGFSWGMLFSSFGRSVINMLLISLAALAALVIGTGYLAQLFAAMTSEIYGTPYQVSFFGIYLTGLLGLAAPAALVGSALVFTRLDRSRLRAGPESLRVQELMLHPSWSMLFWLTWRQARGFTIGIAIFSLFLGFVIFLQPFLLWPAATLIVGVLCGATAFADELQGTLRFLGDQRLPLGRLWVIKVGLRFGIAVVAAMLVLVAKLHKRTLQHADLVRKQCRDALSLLHPDVPQRHSCEPLPRRIVPHSLAGLRLCGRLPFWTALSPRLDGWRLCPVYMLTDSGARDAIADRRRSTRLASVRAACFVADRHATAYASVGGRPHRVVDNGSTAHSFRGRCRPMDRRRVMVSGIRDTKCPFEP